MCSSGKKAKTKKICIHKFITYSSHHMYKMSTCHIYTKSYIQNVNQQCTCFNEDRRVQRLLHTSILSYKSTRGQQKAITRPQKKNSQHEGQGDGGGGYCNIATLIGSLPALISILLDKCLSKAILSRVHPPQTKV